jgi:hypothetical protein
MVEGSAGRSISAARRELIDRSRRQCGREWRIDRGNIATDQRRLVAARRREPDAIVAAYPFKPQCPAALKP